MRIRNATCCPSCGRPVADGAADCPYCGEPGAGAHAIGAAAPVILFLALPVLGAALDALLACRVLPPGAIPFPALPGDAPLPAFLRGLATLLLFLPAAHPAPGAPAPLRIREVAAGLLWRIGLLADGLLFAAALAEAPFGPPRLPPALALAACACAAWRFRLGWRALAALGLVCASAFC